MGLGKTITCVSLIASTLESGKRFAKVPLIPPTPPPPTIPNIGDLDLQPSHFAGSVWGMPPVNNGSSTSGGSSTLSARAQAKQRAQEKAAESIYVRMKRLKVKSRGTLIICPLSTVANWEDQFREHWGGNGVIVVGGSGDEGKESKEKVKKEKDSKCPLIKKEKEKEKESLGLGEIKKEEGDASLPFGISNTPTSSQSSNGPPSLPPSPEQKPIVKSAGLLESKEAPLRIYVYHGNARRPDPAFLADFDAVITTYATLASEYSKQLRSMDAEPPPGGAGGTSNGEGDGDGDSETKGKKLCGMKRKKLCGGSGGEEISSPLQMVHWFRVVLDEAQ
jgi:SWI/SNF-related matrix-associated actin-dependent regulator of chromatin subfamily A3